MYKNIIWDFDGTLFDSYPEIAGAFLSALHDHGRTGDLLEITVLAKVSLDHCLQTLSSTYDLPAKAIDETFRKHYQKAMAWNLVPSGRPKLYWPNRSEKFSTIGDHLASFKENEKFLEETLTAIEDEFRLLRPKTRSDPVARSSSQPSVDQ